MTFFSSSLLTVQSHHQTLLIQGHLCMQHSTRHGISEIIWRDMTAGKAGISPDDAHSTFKGIPDTAEEFGS